MTLPKTTIKNRKNAKKSTGPTTSRGQKKVSSNAITHEARANNFINADEEEAKAALIADGWKPIVNSKITNSSLSLKKYLRGDQLRWWIASPWRSTVDYKLPVIPLLICQLESSLFTIHNFCG